jgi:hypothetical protein
MVSQKDIALLRTRYYRLSGEHRALVIAQAEELAAREPPPPEREGRETAGLERGAEEGGADGGDTGRMACLETGEIRVGRH